MKLLRMLIIAAVLLPCGATAAMAQARSQSSYFGMMGGYSLPRDSDWEFAGVRVPTDYQDGYAIGAFLGTQTDSGLRGEAELSFRTNNLDTFGGVALEGQVDRLALMINVLYEFGAGSGYGYAVGGGLRPYLGLGGGGAMVHINDVNDLSATAVNDSEFGLAYQFIAGFAFELTPDSFFHVDYRYFSTEAIDFSDTGGTTFDAEFADWTVTAGLRTHF